MLRDALSWFTKVKLEAGYVVVLETAGRSGHWNPHVHILMTSGGVTPQQKWREIDDFPFPVLDTKGEDHLRTEPKKGVGAGVVADKDETFVGPESPRPGALLGIGNVAAGGAR